MRGEKLAEAYATVAKLENESVRAWRRRAMAETVLVIGRFVRSFGKLTGVAAAEVMAAFDRWEAAYGA